MADKKKTEQKQEEVYQLRLNPKRSSIAVEIEGTYYHGGEYAGAEDADRLTSHKDAEGRQYLFKSKVGG